MAARFFPVATRGTAAKSFFGFMSNLSIVVFSSFGLFVVLNDKCQEMSRKSFIPNVTSSRMCCCISARSDWLRPEVSVLDVLQNCFDWPIMRVPEAAWLKRKENHLGSCSSATNTVQPTSAATNSDSASFKFHLTKFTLTSGT